MTILQFITDNPWWSILFVLIVCQTMIWCVESIFKKGGKNKDAE